MLPLVVTKSICKWPESERFRICGQCGLCYNYSTLLPLQQESSRRQYVKEWASLCSSAALFIKAGIQLIGHSLPTSVLEDDGPLPQEEPEPPCNRGAEPARLAPASFHSPAALSEKETSFVKPLGPWSALLAVSIA